MAFNRDIKRDQLSNPECTDEHHLVKGKQGAFASLLKLNFLGIDTKYLCPFMKGQLFKIFIRPTLYYCLENEHLHKFKTNQIKRCWDPYKRILNRPKFSETVTVFALDGQPLNGRSFGRSARRSNFWTARINGLKTFFSTFFIILIIKKEFRECNIKSCINCKSLLMMCKISAKCTTLDYIEI
ncbi:hypothetical protein BpHYR1_040634 [Brachionus plicatilis]|uniref:Uncharacterized protein n=1 Tax=Brachionus plicatilis TaxID=10195 RepID=A0A3M7RZD6_BRAPC|nr:hypothetical protein BpHYR1_040634 [Brachionus plicatilis]